MLSKQQRDVLKELFPTYPTENVKLFKNFTYYK
jgi:hypothetical protein